MSRQFATATVRVDICWLLLGLRSSPDHWQFHVKYFPNFESSVFQQVFPGGEQLIPLSSLNNSLGLPPVFDVYLDRHDLQLGDWKKQLWSAISEGDIFVPIATADYAAHGTVCEEEFEKAKAVGLERSPDDFIAPVLVEPKGDVGQELLKLQGLKASSVDSLFKEPAWGDFVRRLVTDGFARISRTE